MLNNPWKAIQTRFTILTVMIVTVLLSSFIPFLFRTEHNIRPELIANTTSDNPN